MNVLLPLLGTLLVVVAVSFCCCCVCSCCCCVSSYSCCCCCCVFSVCFSYTFAAALRKGSGKVGSLPFCCCCCRCCLRATFTAAARHRYTHVYARTHTRNEAKRSWGKNKYTGSTLVHTLTSFRIISCTFLQSLLSCVSMRTFALYVHVYLYVYVYLYVCLCVSTEFLCWRLSYSYSALFPQFVCRQKCIHN